MISAGLAVHDFTVKECLGALIEFVSDAIPVKYPILVAISSLMAIVLHPTGNPYPSSVLLHQAARFGTIMPKPLLNQQISQARLSRLT